VFRVLGWGGFWGKLSWGIVLGGRDLELGGVLVIGIKVEPGGGDSRGPAAAASTTRAMEEEGSDTM
jgi:hypothetical protein